MLRALRNLGCGRVVLFLMEMEERLGMRHKLWQVTG